MMTARRHLSPPGGDGLLFRACRRERQPDESAGRVGNTGEIPAHPQLHFPDRRHGSRLTQGRRAFVAQRLDFNEDIMTEPTHSTKPSSRPRRIAFIQSCWHRDIVDQCRDSFLKEMAAKGPCKIDLYEVPGAFEIPLVADTLAASGRYLAVICLGAVIRGETTHDEHINRAVSLGISESARSSGVPILVGVLTCDTLEQAIHRAGGNVGNKGSESALAALEMINLLAKLK